MKVKDLKKLLETVSGDREIIVSTSLGYYEITNWCKKDTYYTPQGNKCKAFYLQLDD